MKPTAALLTSLLVCGLIGTMVCPVLAQAREEYAAGHLLVKFKRDATSFERSSVLTRCKASILRSQDYIGWHVVALADSEDVLSAIERFRADPAVEYAEPDYLLHLHGMPNDRDLGAQWYLHNTGQVLPFDMPDDRENCTPGADIDAVAAWDLLSEAPNIVIGVLDTGVDCSHPDLAGNAWVNLSEAPFDLEDNDGNTYIDDLHGWDFNERDGDPTPIGNQHGTTVAGYIGAVTNNTEGIAGVCWRTQIMGVRCIGLGVNGYASDLSDGIRYAMVNHAKILNLSAGSPVYGPCPKYLSDVFAQTDSAGLLVVCSAGNLGYDNDGLPRMYPASCPNESVISVAMTDCQDSLVTDTRRCYTSPTTYAVSHYGAVSVDLGAPGCWMFTATTARGKTPPLHVYNYGTGTSASAPLVAGAAALVWTQNPGWTNVQVKERLLQTVDVLPSLQGRVVSNGRLNLRKALDNLAPATVTDLVVLQGATRARLTWTAPADVGGGQTVEYDLRYSTNPINEANFYLATRHPTEPPGSPGAEECELIWGLTGCQNYYFALRAKDDAGTGNWSGISNLPIGYYCGGPFDPTCNLP